MNEPPRSHTIQDIDKVATPAEQHRELEQEIRDHGEGFKPDPNGPELFYQWLECMDNMKANANNNAIQHDTANNNNAIQCDTANNNNVYQTHANNNSEQTSGNYCDKHIKQAHDNNNDTKPAADNRTYGDYRDLLEYEDTHGPAPEVDLYQSLEQEDQQAAEPPQECGDTYDTGHTYDAGEYGDYEDAYPSGEYDDYEDAPPSGEYGDYRDYLD